MKRIRTLAAVAILFVAAAAFAAWRLRFGSKDGAFRYETAEIDRGRVVAKVTATGTLSALVTVQVGSQVSGHIASLHADFNSQVKKGQVIALIDPELFRAAVDQAQANVVAAEGNLAKAVAQAADAERQFRRTRELADRKLVAQADLDTAQSNSEAAAASVRASEGGVAQAKAALSQANVNLAYTRITSPTDGVVISRNVDVGQTVAASLQAPTIFVIAQDLAKMQVDTSVAEADVGRLQAGMVATFTVDAFPGQVFKGLIRQVRNSPQTVQNVVTYDAVVDVANPELLLRPGMTATVTFVYAQKDDVIRLPNSALRFRPPPGMPRPSDERTGGVRTAAPPDTGPAPDRRHGGGGVAACETGRGAATSENDRSIWVLRDSKPLPVRVRTGVTDGTYTELVEGPVSQGDLAITDATGPAGKAQAASAGGRPPRLF